MTTVFKIFFKYPIRYIPVISNGEIFSFVSKDLVLKQSDSSDAFSKAGEKFLDLVLEDPDLQTFFSHIQRIKLDKIPVIDKDRLQINLTKYIDFISQFFPISRLEVENFYSVIEQLEEVVLIYNTKRDLIYANPKAKLFLTSFCKKQKISQKIFLEQVLFSFSDQKLKKLSHTVSTSHAGKFSWSKQFISYPEGIVTLVRLQTHLLEKVL